jgi:TonB family protein
MGMSQDHAAKVIVLSPPPVAVHGDEADAPRGAAEVETVGRKLAAARTARGLAYEDVLKGTKIKIAHLEAIESGDRAALPATPFTAGFVKAYAQFLGLDPDEYSRAYRAEAGAVAERSNAPIEEAGPSASDAVAPRPEKLKSYLGVGATLVFILWIGAEMFSPQSETAQPAARGAASAPLSAPPAAPEEANAAVGEEPYSDTLEAQSDPAAAAASAETGPIAPADVEPAATGAENPSAQIPETTPAQPNARERALPQAASAPPAAIVEPPHVETTPEIAGAAPAAIDETPARLADAAPTPAAAPAAESAFAPAERLAASMTGFPAADPNAAEPKIVTARMIRSVTPKYPDRCARGAESTEKVAVVIDITVEGRPTNARVAETSNDCFDQAAMASVYRMRFSPRTVDGRPGMENAKRVTVQFVR